MCHYRENPEVRYGLLILILGAAFFLAASTYAADIQVSGPFKGAKANTGTVTHYQEGNKHILTLSDTFKVPDAPDPHWQVIDSKGNVYLLQKLSIKGDKINKSIILPAYIRDVTKVQMWCAFAETNLGEAIFARPILLSSK